MNQFVYTTAIRKIRKLTKRKKVIQGGTSAGKTFGILPVLIDRAARTDGLEISVVSECVPLHRVRVLCDVKAIVFMLLIVLHFFLLRLDLGFGLFSSAKFNITLAIVCAELPQVKHTRAFP